MNSDKKYDIVCLGSCTMDNIFEVDDIMRMELIDQDKVDKKYIAIEHSSKTNVKRCAFYAGGSAANIACDLGKIGMRTAYIGGIGADPSGDICMISMKDHNVDVSGVKIFHEDSTAASVILITPWGRDRSILAYKGANNLIGPEHISDEMLLSTNCFAWTSLTSDNGIAAIEKCIKLAKSKGSVIGGAPSISVIKNRLEDTIRLLKQSDVTSMNEEELMSLTKQRDIITGMKILLSWGLKWVNVTMGKEGQWITDGTTLVKTTPPMVIAKDTTGAGDATMSGILYGYLKKLTLQQSAKIAASFSAMEIEGEGVRVGTPNSFEELEEFMKNHPIKQETLKL